MNLISNELLSVINRAATRSAAKKKNVKLGYVTSYNPNTHAVRVRIEPESTANEKSGAGGVVESNWLPLATPYNGNGWGLIVPPNADPNPPYGDQVFIVWADDGQGLAVQGFFNDNERPFPASSATPTGVDGTPVAGEYWLVHASGAHIVIKNDGTIRIRDKQGSVVFLKGDNSIEATAASGAKVVLATSGNATLQSSGGGKVVCNGDNVEIN